MSNLDIHRFISQGGFGVPMFGTICGVILCGACLFLFLFLFSLLSVCLLFVCLFACFLANRFRGFSDTSRTKLTWEVLRDGNVSSV